MNTLPPVLQSKWVNAGSAIALTAIWGLFATVHWREFQKTHELTLLLVVISETLAAGFFVLRSGPKSVSVQPLDWLLVLGGTFVPLLFRPFGSGVLPFASYLVIAGTLLQIAGLISLNRSFALVAARREIKTGWMYRIVRHPIYASYCVIFSGYVLANMTPANLLIYALSMGLLCLRIFREERHLALDLVYRLYMGRVRYRLVPFVF